MPDVSGTYAPKPKNGGIEMKNVYSQMLPIIINDVLYDVILYFSGLVIVRYRWNDSTARVMIDTVPKTRVEHNP